MTWNIERARRPETILTDLLLKTAVGENSRVLWRALVLAYDARGGQLQNPTAVGGITVGTQNIKASIGPMNPPGSIRARVMTDGLDSIRGDEESRVFWPLFSSGDAVLPGEHALVMFEDPHEENGIWLSRVPNHTGQNISPGKDSYTLSSGYQPSAVDLFIQTDPSYQTDDKDEIPGKDVTGLFFAE